MQMISFSLGNEMFLIFCYHLLQYYDLIANNVSKFNPGAVLEQNININSKVFAGCVQHLNRVS